MARRREARGAGRGRKRIVPSVTATFVLGGTRIGTQEDCRRVLMDAFDGPGREYFGRNLDALADCLGGGPGHPEAEDFVVEWHHHAVSRERLGHPETARQAALSLSRCHPSNRTAAEAALADARHGSGPTVFYRRVEVFEKHRPGVLRLR